MPEYYLATATRAAVAAGPRDAQVRLTMANDDPNTSPDAPLAASVADQLREKAHLDELAQADRLASEQRERSVDRRKEQERQAAAAHGGDPATWPRRRRRAHDAPVRRQPTLATLLLVAGAVALVTRIFTRR